MIHAVVFRSGEYHKLAGQWWREHHNNILDERLLSRFGVAVLSKTGPIAIGYIYLPSTSEVAFLGFTVRDPKVSGFKAGKALKMLLAESEEAIRRLGFSIMYTSFEKHAMQKLCKRMGYFQGGEVLEQWKAVR